MANLLPENHMKRIRMDRAIRVTSVFLVFLFVTLTLASVFLAPSLLLSHRKLSEIQARFGLLEETASARNQSDVSRKVYNAGEILAALEETVGRATVVKIIKPIVENTGGQISLRSIDLSLKDGREDGVHMVTLAGQSRDRDTLLAFVRRLGREEMFTEVDLPISSFISSRDIDFSVSLSVASDAEDKNDEE